ncbi:telomerase Cajal body protein 1-like [Styela clava]
MEHNTTEVIENAVLTTPTVEENRKKAESNFENSETANIEIADMEQEYEDIGNNIETQESVPTSQTPSLNPETEKMTTGPNVMDTSLVVEKEEKNNTEIDLSTAKNELLQSFDTLETTNISVVPSTIGEKVVAQSLETTLLASFELGKGNFFKGCKWAPDGLCLMTNSDDNIIRLYNTPMEILSKNWDKSPFKIEVCLKLKEAETIYDYTWWPRMNSIYPETCCLATTAKDQPIHLWDAFNGDLRASYIAKNSVDEITAAHSIAFSPDGLQMICGFTKELRLFYIDRPGDQCEKYPTRKHKRASGQRGIISTSEFHPDGSSIACGSYDGTVALYSSKNGELISIFNAKNKGITQVKFSPDGNRLYTGSRKDNAIVCWDVRFLNGDLFHLERTVDTNQRVYFDLVSGVLSEEILSENTVISGGTDGFISFWDAKSALEFDLSHTTIKQPFYKFKSDRDCTNGVHVHPYLPVLATSSGQRHYGEFSDSESEDESIEIEENMLKLWHVAGLCDK